MESDLAHPVSLVFRFFLFFFFFLTSTFEFTLYLTLKAPLFLNIETKAVASRELWLQPFTQPLHIKGHSGRESPVCESSDTERHPA